MWGKKYFQVCCCLEILLFKYVYNSQYPTIFLSFLHPWTVVNVNVNLKGKLAQYLSWQHYKWLLRGLIAVFFKPLKETRLYFAPFQNCALIHHEQNVIADATNISCLQNWWSICL